MIRLLTTAHAISPACPPPPPAYGRQHNQPALTAERFLPDPDGPPNARLYRTGDLVRILPDTEHVDSDAEGEGDAPGPRLQYLVSEGQSGWRGVGGAPPSL